MKSATKDKKVPTRSEVIEALDYDCASGQFFWRYRASAPKEWNKRWAGKRAGGLDAYGYLNINLFGRLFKAHRLAWLIEKGKWPDGDIDHADRDKLNNRISNLRDCTRAENLQNLPLRSNSTSGFTGVSLCRQTQKWRAKIRIDGEQIHLGRFDTPEEASNAYRIAKGGLHTFHHTIEAGNHG